MTSDPTALGAEATTLDAIAASHLSVVEERLAAQVGGDRLLERMARYHLETGGKRLRALIPPWVCANLGGDPDVAVPFGVGLELIHNGTLVHDDVQDGDEWRRGKPSLWTKHGTAQAINVGDAMYFWGVEALARGPHGAVAVGHVTRAVVGTINGQVMEFQLRPDSSEPMAPSLDAWVATAVAKTGALFGACVACGVIAADRPGEQDRLAAQELGEAIGLIFQVQDDFLDVVGGKGRDRVGTDLAEGKLSYPVAWAYEHGEASEVARLKQIVELPREQTDDALVDEGLALLERTGAIAGTALWLRNMRDSVAEQEFAVAVPGIVERILAPVADRL